MRLVWFLLAFTPHLSCVLDGVTLGLCSSSLPALAWTLMIRVAMGWMAILKVDCGEGWGGC